MYMDKLNLLHKSINESSTMQMSSLCDWTDDKILLLRWVAIIIPIIALFLAMSGDLKESRVACDSEAADLEIPHKQPHNKKSKRGKKNKHREKEESENRDVRCC